MKKTIFFSLAVLGVMAILPAFSAANYGTRPDVDGTPLPPQVTYRVFVHHPHPGKPAPGPSCATTINDQITDYGATGWHLTGPKTYRMNEGTVPSSVGVSNAYNAISEAFATWHAADANISIAAGAPSSLSRAKYDGTNLVAWGSVPGNAIGVTYTWYNTVSGEALESDTIFGKRLPWSYTPYSSDCGGVAGTYDVENIAVHEFGHWIGLDDLYASSQKDLTMYGYGVTAELKKDSLGLGDLLGAAAITP